MLYPLVINLGIAIGEKGKNYLDVNRISRKSFIHNPGHAPLTNNNNNIRIRALEGHKQDEMEMFWKGRRRRQASCSGDIFACQSRKERRGKTFSS